MYPQLSDTQVKQLDVFGNKGAVGAAAFLAQFSQNHVSPRLAAGVSEATSSVNAFVCPAKLVVTKATFMMDVVQVGADNTPTVSLYNLTKSETIAVTAAIDLAGTIGDKFNLVLDSTKVDCNRGDVLQVRIINPAGTIDTALEGKVQIEWNSVTEA